MGGTVAVTIKKDNQFKKMARRTGSYNWLLFSEESNYGDTDKALAEFYASYDEMREDYLSGEPYKHFMSPAYGWCASMIPVDYGFVFVDYDTKEIHSLQGYDSPGSFMMMELGGILNSENQEAKIKLILDDKVNIYYHNDKDWVEESLQEYFQTASNEKALHLMERFNKNNEDTIFSKEQRSQLYFAGLKLKDWKINHYEECIDGMVELFKAIRQHLNPEEIQEWANYAKERFLDDEIDSDLTVQQLK